MRTTFQCQPVMASLLLALLLSVPADGKTATLGSSLLGLFPSELKIEKAIRALLKPVNLTRFHLPFKTPSPGLFLPSPSSPSGSINDNNLPMSASHCKPPSCSASGCASRWKMTSTLGSSLLGLFPSKLKIEKAIRALLEPVNFTRFHLPFKTPSPDLFLPSPSSPSGSINDNNLPMSASHGKPPSCSASGCASRWKMTATLGSSLLGLFPSELKIVKAIRALLVLWQSASSSGSEQYWMRLFGCRDLSILMSSGWGRVRHALHLLQTKPVIKRLVISLVLDKAFWSAIMNNQSVQKFQELLLSDETKSPQICEEVDWGTNNPRWLLDILKDKIMELIESKLLLIETLQPSQPPTAETTALLLSVLIILIIVLAQVPVAESSICVESAYQFYADS